MYESYRAYKKMEKVARDVYMNGLIQKLQLAREYILYKNIPDTQAFDKTLPWPEELRCDAILSYYGNI